MKNTDIIPLLIASMSIIYYIYIIDPFKFRPRNRLYKKLLNNRRLYQTHLTISFVFVLIGAANLLYGNDGHGAEGFAFSPFLFLILIKVANYYSRKYQRRDFYLIMNLDGITGHWLDLICSTLVFLFSLLGPLSVLIVLHLWRR